MTLDLSKPDSLLGSIINQKYKLLGQIGEGGMGRVFKAEQLPLGRAVAVKILRGPSEQEAEDAEIGAFEKRFFLEASTLSKLQHPNLVSVYDYGQIEGNDTPTFFMAMEYLAGDTLHRRIKNRQRLAPREAISIIRQIARGLREAHAMGIVHRDLKPGNVMIVREDEDVEIVKVLDFGLVKVIGATNADEEELTQAGTFLGSPTYIPPEQVRGVALDARVDLYSLGVVFYEMLAGVTPFKGSTIELLLAQVNKRPPSFAERVPGLWIPPSLERVVMKCLEKNPENRQASMDALLQELKECEASLETEPAPKSASAPSSANRSGEHAPVSGGPSSGRASSITPVPPSAMRSGSYRPHPATMPGPSSTTELPKLPPPPALPRDSLDAIDDASMAGRMSDRVFYALILLGSLLVMGVTFALLMMFAKK